MPLFTEITIALVLAALFGFAAHLLKQPPIVGFILAGIAVGYAASPGFVAVSTIEGLAPIGVALLLFLVGLEMDFRELKSVGVPALLTGLGQIVFTFGIGYAIAAALGFSTVSAVYISIALTFSSTIIVVKLLSEKKDLKSLYGRIVVGFLLVQDFVAILALVFLAELQGESLSSLNVLSTLAVGGGLVLLTLLASHFLPKVLDRVARSQEMLYLFSIAWALGVAAATEAAGLSIEVGGFLAGIALANSSEHFQIGARLRPVRDFFLILFFVALGAKMLVGGGAVPILPAVLLSLFVLFGNPLIVMVVMGALGYRARTSFLASLTVAQISEFSLIIAALGLRLGHLGAEEVGLITLVGIITISVSSYFIIYSDRIYRALRPALRVFEFRRKLVEETAEEREMHSHVVLIGVHRTGRSIVQALRDAGEEFIALDFDPVLVRKLKTEGVPVVYGDVSDEDIQETVGIERAKLVISTSPDREDNLTVLAAARRKGGGPRVVLTADDEPDAKEFYKRGADYVILPHFVGGWRFAEAMRGGFDPGLFGALKQKDEQAMGEN